MHQGGDDCVFRDLLAQVDIRYMFTSRLYLALLLILPHVFGACVTHVLIFLMEPLARKCNYPDRGPCFALPQNMQLPNASYLHLSAFC